MSLIIYKEIDNTYVDEALARWKLLAKVKFRNLRAYAFLSAIYLIIGINKYVKYGIFWTFWMAFAIAFLLLMCISALILYNERKEWILKAKNCIQKQASRNTPIEYVFSEDMITVKDVETYHELKWGAFSYYQLFGNYILFYLSESNSIALTLEISKVPVEIYSKVLKLTQSKLVEKQ